jgi:hypothetical protein
MDVRVRLHDGRRENANPYPPNVKPDEVILMEKVPKLLHVISSAHSQHR